MHIVLLFDLFWSTLRFYRQSFFHRIKNAVKIKQSEHEDMPGVFEGLLYVLYKSKCLLCLYEGYLPFYANNSCFFFKVTKWNLILFIILKTYANHILVISFAYREGKIYCISEFFHFPLLYEIRFTYLTTEYF